MADVPKDRQHNATKIWNSGLRAVHNSVHLFQARVKRALGEIRERPWAAKQGAAKTIPERGLEHLLVYTVPENPYNPVLNDLVYFSVTGNSAARLYSAAGPRPAQLGVQFVPLSWGQAGLLNSFYSALACYIVQWKGVHVFSQAPCRFVPVFRSSLRR